MTFFDGAIVGGDNTVNRATTSIAGLSFYRGFRAFTTRGIRLNDDYEVTLLRTTTTSSRAFKIGIEGIG